MVSRDADIADSWAANSDYWKSVQRAARNQGKMMAISEVLWSFTHILYKKGLHFLRERFFNKYFNTVLKIFFKGII